SFQIRRPESTKRFAKAAEQLIGSINPLYPAIFTALNASIPYDMSDFADNGAILVLNNPTAATNNLTQVFCVGHKGKYYGTNHNPESPDAMISCRETRITVMANKAFKAKVEPEDPPPVASDPTESDPEETVDPDDPRAEYYEYAAFPYWYATDILKMYNSQAPTLMTLSEIAINNMTIDSLDEIDRDMPALLKAIADR
ncbi:hypothetical protein BGZ70_006491, partial [Mortierella alpina]